MIGKHFAAIREQHSIYRGCLVRIFIEANMSFIDAKRIANQLDVLQYQPVDIVSEDKSKLHRVGVWTTTDKKEAFAEELQRCVPHMQFAREFICDTDEKVVKQELFGQLLRFRKEVVQVNNPDHTLHLKVVYTGKGPNQKDDLVLALSIGVYHMMRSIYRDPEFRQRCEQQGMMMRMGA